MKWNFKRLWSVLFGVSAAGYALAGSFQLILGELSSALQFGASSVLLVVGIVRLQKDRIDFEEKTLRLIWFNVGFIAMAGGLSVDSVGLWTFGFVSLLAGLFGEFRKLDD